MKKIITSLLFLLLGICFVLGEQYKVNVTRVESNLYKDTNSGIYIKTRYCYEYAYSQDATLKWEGAYGNNWLIFDSGTKCDVEKLLKE